jgi:hypothetical protein
MAYNEGLGQRQGKRRAKGTRGIDADLVSSIREGELHRVRTLWHNAGTQAAPYKITSYRGHVWTVDKFTFEDFKTYGRVYGKHPRFVAPCDATRDEIKAYLKTQRLKRNAQARRDRRAALKMRQVEASDLNCRSSAIVTVLTTDRWQSVRDLAKALKGIAVFFQPNGKPLPPDSMTSIIHRELKRPAMAEVVITGKKPAKRGDILVVKLRTPK